MKRLSLVGALLGSLALAATAQAKVTYQVVGGGEQIDELPKTMVVGAHGDLGMAYMVGRYVDRDLADKKVRFNGGGGAYFDFYLNSMLALEGGIDFVGKGYRERGHYYVTDWNTYDTKTVRLIYLEIPLGAKLNIKDFQASLLFTLNFALKGTTTLEEKSFTPSKYEWGDDDWDNYRRFNIGPKIVLGYAIPIGPISLVPGFYWSIHLINDSKVYPAQYAMNFMFRVALEFGF